MKSFYFYLLIIQEGHRKTNSQPETTVPTPADHTSRTLPPVLVWVGAVPRLWRWWRQKDENGQSGLPFKCWRVGLKAPRKFDPMGTNLQSKTKTTSRWVKISFFHLEGKMGANKKCWDRILDETRPWRVDTGTGNQQEGTTDIKTVTRDAEQHRKFHPSNTFIKGLVWFSFPLWWISQQLDPVSDILSAHRRKKQTFQHFQPFVAVLHKSTALQADDIGV